LKENVEKYENFMQGTDVDISASGVTGTLQGLHEFNQHKRANTPPPLSPLDLDKARPQLHFSQPTPTFPLSTMPSVSTSTGMPRFSPPTPTMRIVPRAGDVRGWYVISW